MKKLIILGTALLANVFAIPTFAAITSAGTVISNTATVNYEVGANSLVATSAAVTVTVQELIQATLESNDAGKQKTVSSGQTNAALLFKLTNTGNGDEAFEIMQENLLSDDFDSIFDTVYVDTDDDGIFEPGTDDIAYTPTEISPGASLVLWVASKDFSNTQNNGDKATILVSAISKTFSDALNTNPSAGDVVRSQGTSNTDAIHATSGNANDEANFIMDTSGILVTIDKTITNVSNTLGATDAITGMDSAIPGAEVSYKLVISIEGSGTAQNVTVSDQLTSELKLKGDTSGYIIVDGNTPGLTANIADNDGAAYDANTKTITVNLGDVVAATPATQHTVEFTTVIQ